LQVYGGNFQSFLPELPQVWQNYLTDLCSTCVMKPRVIILMVIEDWPKRMWQLPLTINKFTSIRHFVRLFQRSASQAEAELLTPFQTVRPICSVYLLTIWAKRVNVVLGDA
jgi:hypothetical protein